MGMCRYCARKGGFVICNGDCLWCSRYKEVNKMENAERCVCCGEIIPEGRMVCPNCEAGSKGKETPCDFCKGRAYTKKPVTIITAYGKRFQMVFEHCPNCGRKLRTDNGK